MSLYRNNKPYRLAQAKASNKATSFYLLAERAKARNLYLTKLLTSKSSKEQV